MSLSFLWHGLRKRAKRELRANVVARKIKSEEKRLIPCAYIKAFCIIAKKLKMMERAGITMKIDQGGYSIVELLVVIVIIGVLCQLSFGLFQTYKKNAYYSTAIADLRNAKTAFEIGASQLPSGYNKGPVFTLTTGGPVLGDVKEMLPGAVSTTDVQLGVQYSDCALGGGINQFLEARSCKASKIVRWMKFCDGAEIEQRNIGGGC